METKIPLTFKVYRGASLLREETLTQDIIKVGKLESSHLRLDDDSVSRMHAAIEVGGNGEIHIIDLGSARGTVVNGQKVNKCQLQDGDEVFFGDTRVVIGVGQPIQVAAVAPAAQLPSVPMPTMPPPAGFAPAGVPMAGSVVPPPLGAPMQAGFLPTPASSMATQGLAAGAAQMNPTYQAVNDPALDVQDGSRAIEITALFEDAVINVRHLNNPSGGHVTGGTWAAIGSGAVGLAGGLVLALFSTTLVGMGALLMILGMMVFVYGFTRRQREQKSPHYVVGEASAADVHLRSESLPASMFPLVRATGTDYSFLYTAAMSGDVTLGAERIPLGQLAATGRAAPTGEFSNTYAYSIPQNARIKVDVGDNTFLINSVPPARSIVAPFLSTVDWAAQRSNGISFAAHAVLLFLIFAIPPDAKSLSLDLFNTDNKFVKFLIKPPEQKEEEIPDWLKKKGMDEAGGKGQRHKGDEGKMGKKESQSKQGLYGLKGPKDNPDPHLAKRLAEEQAQNAGVLGLLKQTTGSHLSSIFGRDSALGTDAEDVLGGLVGNQIGEAYGVGGLGLVGSGRGGGGTGEGTIGLGSLGTIGKGGGGGDGSGYGRGVGGLKGRAARAPNVMAGTAEVKGSLDKEIIRRIIRQHINEVKYCYAKELQGKPDLAGRVMIQFTIAATGQVVQSLVQNSSMGSPPVETCIAQAVRRWLFPKPKGGGIVVVSYPFVLRAAGAE